MDVPGLRRRLLAWYDRHRRDLPWRRTKDPYAIWVSEVMLQQTRVEVVVPYFGRWMERFPTMQALAKAPQEKVLQAWSGLGYYSRARNLHSAAKVVAKEHGRAMPRDASTLRTLPGIGAYTAGAVASIAFGQPVPAIDGNVVRVVARLVAVQGDVRMPAQRKRIEDLAAQWVAPRRPGDWNQALMDLGATVCTPRSPSCEECPLSSLCGAFRAGLQEIIPGLRKGGKVPVERRHYAAVVQDGKLLLVRNPPEGLLAGLWSLPGGLEDEDLAGLVERQTGVAVQTDSAARRAIHQFSHRTWQMTVRKAKVVANGRLKADAKWVRLDSLPSQALSTAMRTAVEVGLGATKAKTLQESGTS